MHICYLNSRQSAFVHMQLATQIVASLLALEAADEAQDIQLYINSQGKSSSRPHCNLVDAVCTRLVHASSM